MGRFDVKKAVLASTTYLQGGYKGYPQISPFGFPITLADFLPSDSDYGTSKIFAEALADQFFASHKIRTVCLRIGSVTPNDQPFPPYERVWLSYRDASQVFFKALNALEDKIDFGIYYATSKRSL